MQHARDVKSPPAPEQQPQNRPGETPDLTGDGQHLYFRDRTSPSWLVPLSLLFTLGIEICVVAISILPIFFLTMVVSEGQLIMAYILTILAAAPLLGILIFETGYIKAFWGHAESRKKMNTRMRATLASLVAFSLAIVHPLLATPYFVAFFMGGALAWGCSKALHRESAWEFLHQEAVSVLSGRDQQGLHLAQLEPRNHSLIDACLRSTTLLSLVVSIAVSTWLAANDIVNPAAIATIALLNFWGAEAFAALFKQKFRAHGTTAKGSNNRGDSGQRAQVMSYLLPEDKEAEANEAGLFVNGLSVEDRHGKALLSNVSFAIAPGTAMALTGNNFSGKSLLMRGISSPHDLSGTDVRGTVRIDGDDPWVLRPNDQALSAAYLPANNLLIPGSGLQNLACFGHQLDASKAEKILRQFVFTTDTARQILNTDDVRQLSTTELKALGFARLFYLRPRAYLLDRPEDGATPELISALAKKIEKEKRYGATFLITTDNRELLDLCEKTVVMTAGRVADIGPTADIRKQNKIGWTGLTTQRSLESEAPLDSWLSSQFRRDNDSNNRRNVCMVANELLAFSCQNLSPGTSEGEIRFEFKNFKGHCVLRMIDDDQPLSSGIFEQMQNIARSSDDMKRIPPLAAAMKLAKKLDAGVEGDMRVIEAHILTYDPRNQTAKPTTQTTGSTEDARHDTPNGT